MRSVTPEIIRRQVVLEELDLAPDATRAVVVRRHVEGIDYRRALWLVPLAGGRPRPLTGGLSRDSHPRFSPDGRRIAFLSRRASGDAPDDAVDEPDRARINKQIWIIPVDGGEPWPLTRTRHGIEGFAWSPQGDRIAFWGPTDPSPILVGERSDGREPTTRRITAGGWRWDEEGLRDHRTHLAVVAVRRGARPLRLTEGDFDVVAPAWDPDGQSLVFCAARHELADLHPRPSVFRVGSGQRHRELVEIARLGGLVESATPSPDGRWLALLGVDVDDAPDDAAPTLFVTPSDGTAAPMPLAADLDLPVGAWIDTDLNGWATSARIGPFWDVDGDGRPSLVALASRRGRCLPWRFPLPAGHGRPQPLVEAEAACWALSVAEGAVAVLGTLGGRAMELMTVEDDAFRTVTSLGSRWQRAYSQPLVEDRWVAGAGGPIEVWLASPPGAGGAPLPLVVDVHGGPLGAWAPAPSLEVQMLVSAGYRVALPNIRGSAGYGAAWIHAHMGHWGEVDAEDVLSVVDDLVAEGLADPQRLGLLGLSYGGFLVNWLIGAAPDRFAAAVSEAGVANQVAAWALSDSGPDYNRRSRLGDPLTPEGVELLWRQSPLRNVRLIRTPLLMLQGQSDLRCPPADNEQLFVALRSLGRTVEYVLYPESYHVFAITGRPDRRIDRNRRMLDWFRRYLA